MAKLSLNLRLSRESRIWIENESKQRLISRSELLDGLVKEFIKGKW